MYATLLLKPGLAQPRFIPLFEEKSLDSLLQTAGDRRADYVNQLYTLAERGAKPLGKPQKHCTNCSGSHWKHTSRA